MSNFLARLKKAARAATSETGPIGYVQAGRAVQCPHCGNKTFELGSAQLNTAGMSFLNLDWANRSATLLVCTECTRIQWFMDAPERRSMTA